MSLLTKSHLATTFLAGFLLIANASAEPIVPGLAGHSDPDQKLVGSVLMAELNCAACHELSQHLATTTAPDLRKSISFIEADYTQRFIADPQKANPGSTMPDTLSGLSDDERSSTAEAITHYLYSLPSEKRETIHGSKPSVQKGQKLYHEIGCVACHSPAKENDPPFPNLDQKFQRDSLATYLLDPLAVRPSGRMPDFKLTATEAQDLAAYLIPNEPPEKAFTPNSTLAAKGQQLFTQHRCNSCHQVDESAPDRKTFSLASFDTACLAPAPTAPAPNYSLTDSQRASIRHALSNRSTEPSADELTKVRLTQLNCIACHTRDDFGGPSEELDTFFTTTNLNLGEQARIPPTLTDVGSKLKPDWLKKVIESGESVRPYMHTRMPVFGKENTTGLSELLSKADESALPKLALNRIITVDDEQTEDASQTGRQLAGDKGFGCIACHSFLGKTANTLNALDLTTMTTRLNENWFHTFLRDPLQFHPESIMPSYWPGGKSTRPDVLGGDRDQQIDAIWRYLSYGRESIPPSGIRPDPIPIVVPDDDAVIIRRQFEGIGKRGIGVGYPTGIHLSFDAGQLRLHSIWRGDFADATAIWSGQGAGNVKVCGSDQIRFPSGPAIAQLASSASPWPESKNLKAPDLKWLGYQLDAQQRPSFLYQLGTTKITDTFRDIPSERPHFERSISLPIETLHNETPLYLRITVDKSIKDLTNNEFQIGKKLRITLPAQGIIRPSLYEKGTHELLLPLKPGTSIISYHW